MNRERAKELLPIIEAFANGEEIEFQMESGAWTYVDDPAWFEGSTYRIKAKPREFMIDPTGSRVVRNAPNPDMTDNFVAVGWIKVREVIE